MTPATMDWPDERRRIHGFDWLRVVCMVAVVAIHTLSTCPSLLALHRVLSFAVPCFVMMSLVLLFPRVHGASLRERGHLLVRRSARLAQPYLVWSGVFFILRSLFGTMRYSVGNALGVLLLGGAAMHLYFIPLLLLFTLLSCAMPPRGGVPAALWVALFLVSTCVHFTGCPSLPFGNHETRAFPAYLCFELPFLFAGGLLGLWYWRSAHGAGRNDAGLGWVGLFVPWGGAILCRALGVRLGGTYAGSLLLVLSICLFFLGFLAIRRPLPVIVSRLAAVAMGVYYVHPVFLAGMMRLETALGWDHGHVAVTIARFGLVLIASVLASTALQRTPRLAFLVR